MWCMYVTELSVMCLCVVVHSVMCRCLYNAMRSCYTSIDVHMTSACMYTYMRWLHVCVCMYMWCRHNEWSSMILEVLNTYLWWIWMIAYKVLFELYNSPVIQGRWYDWPAVELSVDYRVPDVELQRQPSLGITICMRFICWFFICYYTGHLPYIAL